MKKQDLPGQEHVLTFWEQLNEDERKELQESLSVVNVERANAIFAAAFAPATQSAVVAPLPETAFDTLSPNTHQRWRKVGLDLIAENKIAVVLLAGGQGTRLGSSNPKGMYDIGLPSGKSLFQYQAERILALQRLGSGIIPWYIMTSAPTRKPTQDFFKQNNYFGIDPTNVMFFNQGVLPGFSPDGKFLLESKKSLFTAPDGNGGIYAALRSGGVLADLKKRNIPYVHVYCVDNCLVKVADPVFMGYCVEKNADCGAKVVHKSSWDEQVGVICLKNEKPAVVEYSEIGDELARQTRDDGRLAYDCANIANHFYTTEFLEGVEALESSLSYHVAKKKIKHIDLSTGSLVTPTTPNGIKLELFIFDVFPHTQRMAVLQVDRSSEFSPLKNKEGKDSAETSRRDVTAMHAGWLKQAGAVIKGDGVVEVSPLVSYDGEGLDSLKGVQIDTPMEIAFDSDMKKLKFSSS